jgi:uncharacterized protein YjiK
MLSRFISIGLAFFLCACNDPGDNSPDAPAAGSNAYTQWKLPGKLREISGLALTNDQRLLAITDEDAIVYELDYDSGAINKAFALGQPTVRGDFEGIAVVDQTVWLLTSDGQLFATSEGRDGERMNYAQYDTGLGEYCELEGLAQDGSNKTLLLACKETRSKRHALKIFQVSVAGDEPEQTGATTISQAEIAEIIDGKHVRPSGIAIDPASGNRILVAANHKALITYSPDGTLIDAIILPGSNRHRQAEGIEITKDGRLLIADEGGNGQARLAVYRWTSTGLEPE